MFHRAPVSLGRLLGLTLLSVGVGALAGTLAALGMGAGGFMIEFGAVFGGAAGLLGAPAMIWAAWHGSTIRAAAMIVPPAALAAWAGGLLTPRNAGPYVAMGLSVFVYVFTCYIFGLWSRMHTRRLRRLENACVECGYSLRGLPRDAPCPECGSRSRTTDRDSDRAET